MTLGFPNLGDAEVMAALRSLGARRGAEMTQVAAAQAARFQPVSTTVVPQNSSDSAASHVQSVLVGGSGKRSLKTASVQAIRAQDAAETHGAGPGGLWRGLSRLVVVVYRCMLDRCSSLVVIVSYCVLAFLITSRSSLQTARDGGSL